MLWQLQDKLHRRKVLAWQRHNPPTHAVNPQKDKTLTPPSRAWWRLNERHERKHKCCGHPWPTHAKSPPKISPMSWGKFLRDGRRLQDNTSWPQGFDACLAVDKETLILPSLLQCPYCVSEGTKGLKWEGQLWPYSLSHRDISQGMCGVQAIVTQWVTVQYKDSELFSQGSSQLLMWKCFGHRKSVMLMAFCPFVIFLISHLLFIWLSDTCMNSLSPSHIQWLPIHSFATKPGSAG